ncbi:MAG TPA: molybdenum cofactor biosysynthesis protein [Chthoniobacterales bacterium]|jgi:MOSC domain-containing protein YiiM
MNSESAAIKHLFISEQHNFVGHHGRDADEYSTRDCSEVLCRSGSGIVGDRYFNHKPDYKGQITFFAWETFERIRLMFPHVDLSSSVFRRNVITTGLDLNELIGVEFEVQGIWFAGTEEARPCYWMDRVIGDGAKSALEGFGGLRARILTDGTLKVGPCALRTMSLL